MKLDAIGIVSADMKESIRFYRLLGLDFPDSEEDHIEAATPDGLRVMLDSEELMKQLDPKWVRPKGQGMVLAFLCESPGHVDRGVRKGDVRRLQGQESAMGCVLGPEIRLGSRPRRKLRGFVRAALSGRDGQAGRSSELIDRGWHGQRDVALQLFGLHLS